MDPEMLGHLFKTIKQDFKKCLEPRMSCPNAAIRAHSIQNSKVLDLLVEDHHVTILEQKMSKDAPRRAEFDLIGRNKASTFLGRVLN